jgi:hypothetical protein
MTDKSIFLLDADGRWRLAYDRQQWVLQRRVGNPLPGRSGSAAGATSGWKAVSFIGSEKRILHRCIREHGVALTPDATARLDALPERFVDFLVDRAEMKPPALRRAA